MRQIILILAVALVMVSRALGQCSCWIEPDSSYSLISNNSGWNVSGFNNNDDGSHGPISLPFTFRFFGGSENTVFINVNGNVSFGTSYGSFSSTGFPVTAYRMIAPFWADVDLGAPCANCDQVAYKVTSTALYVNWTNVGYYNEHIDKLNAFQLIITDGTDPIIPNGNNVAFCYRDMQWTTGDASMGNNGFDGTPASVGVNPGDGVQYAQIGRFSSPGDAYDGPFGATDGVDWLDSAHFYLNAADTAGVPPIFASGFDCDTIIVQVGQSYGYDMLVIAGGPGQTVTTTSSCPSLTSYQEVTNVDGALSVVTSNVLPEFGEIGFHPVFYTAQNDLQTPQNSIYQLVIQVVEAISTALPDPSAAFLSAFPNPSNAQVVIRWPSGVSPEQIDLFGADGRVVSTIMMPPRASQATISVSDLTPGTYFIRATAPSGSLITPLVKTP